MQAPKDGIRRLYFSFPRLNQNVRCQDEGGILTTDFDIIKYSFSSGNPFAEIPPGGRGNIRYLADGLRRRVRHNFCRPDLVSKETRKMKGVSNGKIWQESRY
jgi:hypothetical protein